MCPEAGLLNTIQAAFGPDRDLSHWNVPKEDRKHIRVIIATVPDPAHTRLSYMFDRQIDAIQEAVQTSNYLFARSWMPWDSADHPESDDFRIRLGQKAFQNTMESYPGLMIFRKAGSANDPIANASQGNPVFVLIVGESPTEGINKDQFRKAIEIEKAICSTATDCSDYKARQSLYVLGPMFSGSLYSLDALLREFIPSTFPFAIVNSGTVSGFNEILWFQNDFHDGEPGSHVSFRAFQESSDYVIEHFLRLTCDEGYRSDQVAVLSEDETAYGNQNANVQSTSDCADLRKVVHLYFPRNISQLRSAYQQDLKNQADQGSQISPRPTLSANLDDNGSDDDTVPPYSRTQTPLSQEGVMLSISKSLAEHHAQFVIIEATSSLDSLFLVRFLRASSSQARIVTIDADLLFPRQADDSSLHGVMAITTYPLIPAIDHQLWTPSEPKKLHIDRTFPGNYSAGAFNALVALLKFQDPQTQVPVRPCVPARGTPCVDLIPAQYADYGWPAMAGPGPVLGKNVKDDDGKPLQPLAPPLWLTVLGRDGYSPIAILGAMDSKEVIPWPVPSVIHAVIAHTVEPTLGIKPRPVWLLLCSIQLSLIVAYVTFLWRGSILSNTKFVVCFAPVADPWRNVMFFLAAGVLAAVAIALLWPWLFWGRQFGDIRFSWAFGLVNAFGILIIAMELVVRKSPGLALMLVAASSASFACLCAWTSTEKSRPVATLVNLRLYRYVDPSSGVSPCLPFLLLAAALLWWAWYRLASRGLWSEGSYRPKLPGLEDVVSEGRDQTLASLTYERNKRLIGALERTRRDYRVVIPLFLVTALAIPFVWPRPVRSLEGLTYDRIYGISLAVVIFSLVWAVFQMLMIWVELRPLLRALDRLPLRHGFKRMKDFTWRPVWQLGGASFQDFLVIVTRELDAVAALRNMGNNDPSVDERLEKLKEAETDLRNFMRGRDRASPQPPIALPKVAAVGRYYDKWVRCVIAPKGSLQMEDLSERLRNLQQALASVSAILLRHLNLQWQREGLSERVQVDWIAQGLEVVSKKSSTRLASRSNRTAEDFLCLFYFNFISAVFMSMRSLTMMIAGVYVFVLLSFGSYPFEPRLSFRILAFFIFIMIVATVAFVLAQMHKDATLSRITKTNPGELGIDFWLRLALFVSVPLLSLVASAFPSVGGFLFSWLQPAAQAFK
jgi:hypothetical protein